MAQSLGTLLVLGTVPSSETFSNAMTRYSSIATTDAFKDDIAFLSDEHLGAIAGLISQRGPAALFELVRSNTRTKTLRAGRALLCLQLCLGDSDEVPDMIAGIADTAEDVYSALSEWSRKNPIKGGAVAAAGAAAGFIGSGLATRNPASAGATGFTMLGGIGSLVLEQFASTWDGLDSDVVDTMSDMDETLVKETLIAFVRADLGSIQTLLGSSITDDMRTRLRETVDYVRMKP